MIILLIYIISIIGVILSIRYNDSEFKRFENSTLIFVFCPLLNTAICLSELLNPLVILLLYVYYKITNISLNNKIYKLIRLGRR